jgi:hypothetical protein
MAARISEEGEGLVVQIETWIADPAIETDDRHDRRIRRDEVLAEILKRMTLCFAPRAAPAEPASFAVGERLASDDPCAVRPSQRPAVEADRLVKSAANAIRT